MSRDKLQNLKVLVVDDSAYMRELLSSILRAFGTSDVCLTESALDATHALVKFQAQVAIVDWMMSPVNGIEFVKHLRHSTVDRFRYLPIVMLTGHTDDENVSMAKDVGVNGFLGKPFTPNALYDQITHVMEKPSDFRVETPEHQAAQVVGKSFTAIRR